MPPSLEFSIPNSKGQRMFFQRQAAFGARVRVVPELDAVGRGNRASRLELNPFEPRGCGEGQAIENRLEARGRFQRSWPPERAGRSEARGAESPRGGRGLREFDARNCVVEVLAVAAGNGLNHKSEPLVGAARHLCPETAPGAFKQIRPAHGRDWRENHEIPETHEKRIVSLAPGRVVA